MRDSCNADNTRHLDIEEWEKLINKIFSVMKLAFLNQYEKYYGMNNEQAEKRRQATKRMWAKSEQLLVFNHQQINQALSFMVNHCQYMPSLSEFINICKSAELKDQPKWEDAWDECCQNSHRIQEHQWSSGLVAKAGQKTGWHLIRSATGHAVERAKERFKKNYLAISDQVIINPEILLLENQSTNSEATRAIQHSKETLQKTMQEQGIPSNLSRSECLSRLKSHL